MEDGRAVPSSEIPTTRDPGVLFFSMSPTVKPLKLTERAVAPRIPDVHDRGVLDDVDLLLEEGSNHWLATMPECQPLRPDNSTEWPGPVSVLPWRYIAFEKIAPRSGRVLNPPR